MNRRDMLKGALSGLAFASFAKAKNVETVPFEPDIILDRHHRLSRYLTVYLDGTERRLSFAACVKWESFERPTYGRVVVAAERDGKDYVSVDLYEPREGEFDEQGVWVHVIEGQVYIKLEGEGQRILEDLRREDREATRQHEARARLSR